MQASIVFFESCSPWEGGLVVIWESQEAGNANPKLAWEQTIPRSRVSCLDMSAVTSCNWAVGLEIEKYLLFFLLEVVCFLNNARGLTRLCAHGKPTTDWFSFKCLLVITSNENSYFAFCFINNIKNFNY